MGKGRLAEPEDVVAAVQRRLGGTALAGRAVVVTAGPTFEDIDPVRFVGNRSSGRMGYAVAQEAARRGAAVVLVTGPTHLDPPPGVDVVRVRSAAEMHRAVMDRAAGADAVIMAAAVADYTPEAVEPQKVAKKDGGWTLPLVRTIDILAELGKLPSRAAGRPVLIGFAAETHDVLAHADAKRRRKGVDLIVANDVSRADAGFEVGTNAVTFVSDEGQEPQPLLSKAEVAGRILDRARTPARRGVRPDGGRDDARRSAGARRVLPRARRHRRQPAARVADARGVGARAGPRRGVDAAGRRRRRRRSAAGSAGRGAGRAQGAHRARLHAAASCTRWAAGTWSSASAARRRR